jgi:DNA-binding GntR family transcriptional regulator
MVRTKGPPAKASGTLNSRAYDRIRADILTCHLPPGSVVSEAALAEKYEFGKSSIRNVLTRLIQEGMVVNRGRKGHIVRPLTLRELRDIFQLRLLMEPQTAAIAASEISEAGIERLKSLTKDASHTDKSDPNAVITGLMANRTFHVAIAEATGNELLMRFMSRVHDNMLRFAYLTVATSRETEIMQEYQDIIAALSARDPDRAAQVMRRHIENSERNVMRAVSNLPGILNVNLAISL